ncbi:MAG: hypothetical protein KY428_07730, partial [Bacteroidetes bacterium]|nr:hypothetical protein [Bacteroidota bacterium]
MPIQVGDLRYFADATNQMGYSNMEKLPPQSWSTVYRSVNQGGVWVKFSLKNNSNQAAAALLVAGDVPLMYLYLQRATGLEQQQSGMYLAVAERSLPHHKPYFSISLAAGEEVTALLKLDSQNRQLLPAQFKPQLRSPEAQQREDNRRLLIQGLFMGIILVMAFYNLILYVAVKDISYLWYVLSILGIGFYFFFYYGFSLQTIWRHQPVWNAYSFALIVPLTNMMRVMFTKTYLHTRESFPWLNTYLNGLLVLGFVPMLIGGLAYWFGYPWYELTIDATGIFGTLVLGSMLLAGALTYLRGYTPALFFIVA